MTTPIFCDTREPWPHPWESHIPEAIFVREGLETGDLALAGNPASAIERKTVSDFLGSITAGRDRFEAELKRARLLDHFCIIVEGSLIDVLEARGGMTVESVIGSVAAITRRGAIIHFAGTERFAARLAWRILSQPAVEANRLVNATKKAAKKAAGAAPVTEDGRQLY